jgi:hypothetical protein
MAPRSSRFRLVCGPVFLGACGLLLWRLPKAPQIEYPCLGMPVILRAGEEFSAAARCFSLPWNQPQWSLRRLGQEVPLAVEQQSGWWRVSCRLSPPAGLEPGAYELVLRVGGQERARAAAVHLLAPEQAQNALRLVHMADLPILVEEQGFADWQQILNEVRHWQPDAVLLGGDIAYTGLPLAWERLEAGLIALDLPVIVAIGNHEFEGFQGFVERFGKPWHRVDVGAYCVLTMATLHGRDQFNAVQLDWLERELESLEGRTCVLQMHHPFYGENSIDRGRERFLELLVKHGVRLVVSGDVHYDHGFDQSGVALPLECPGGLPPGPIFLCTTSAGRHVRRGGPFESWPGFRVIEFEGASLTRVGFDADQDGIEEPARSLPWGRGILPWPKPGAAGPQAQTSERSVGKSTAAAGEPVAELPSSLAGETR